MPDATGLNSYRLVAALLSVLREYQAFKLRKEGPLRRFHLFVFWIMIVGVAATAQQPQSSAPARAADDKAATEKRLRDLEDRVVMLEGELRQLKAQQTQPAQAPATTTAAAPATPAGNAPQPQATATSQGAAGATSQAET